MMKPNLQFSSYLPSKHLRQYIDYYWIAKCTNGKIQNRMVSVFPITMHNLIFFFGDIPYRIDEKGSKNKMPEKCAIGMITKSQKYMLWGKLSFISIRFKSLGIYRLFDNCPTDFVDKNSDFESTQLNELYKQLGELSTPNLIVQKLNSFFLNSLIKFDDKEEKIKAFQYCINTILHSRGNVKIQHFLNELNISERGFRNLFLNYSGISPKLFSRIVRFNYTYANLLNNINSSVLDLIHEAGYFDQAHFIKEFKQFTQSTVSNFSPDFLEFDELHRFKNI